jgi:hypothetical protein
VLWVARALWLVLAFTNAAAIDEATTGWSSTMRVTAAVLAWALWGSALVALLAPRPAGFTLLRVAVTAATLAALVCAFDVRATIGVPAALAALAAIPIVTGAHVAHAASDALAYGYERRFPVRAPFALVLGGIPLASAVAAAGVCTPALLLADGRVPAGLLVAVVGLPLAGAAGVALHRLSLRLLVVVPAGLTIVDPLTLADAVLLPEASIAAIEPAAAAAPPGACDLRLGTALGSLSIRTHTPVALARRAGRTSAETASCEGVLVSPVRAQWLLRALADRPRVRG